MTITALPEATVRLLGSAQALTTPTSLVKELIDNALDAKASTIDILISTNTIDKIEVRDNGHGIPQEDLDALGKHGHTSKLRSFEELRSIGGLSLGFRGEALASACQLGEVSVTTKTEGEPAATVVKLKPLGGIASQSRTSNPIGTTVTVTNFLSKLPVRKQNALKETSKILTKLKDLLQAYCLARPRVRFSLKMIKSPKGSWSYAPRPNDGIKEAVSLVIGRETASQCLEKSLVFPEHGYTDDIDEDDQTTEAVGPDKSSSENGGHQFVIQMFLPKPDADVSKIGHGQFISIDSRPVSHDKGTVRKIVTLFRSYLKSSFSDSSEKLKNPFLWMDIRCPVASYDANVEPAKDDVLFCNEALVLESIEKAFEDIYGERKEHSKTATSKKFTVQIDNIEVLDAQVPEPRPAEDVETPSMSAASSEPAFETLPTPPQARADQISEEANHTGSMVGAGKNEELPSRNWRIDMSEDYSREIEGLYKPNHRDRFPDTSQASSLAVQAARSNDLNPWLIAKMNAPLQRPQDISTNGFSSIQPQGQSHDVLPTPQQSSDPLSPDLETLHQRSNQARPRQTFRAEDVTSLTLSSNQGIPRQRSRQPIGEIEDELLLGDDSTTLSRRNDFISARQLPDDPSMLPGPAQPTPFKRLKGTKGVNNPFTPPTRTGEGAPVQDGLRQTKLGLGKRLRTVSNPQELPSDSDLAWAMDFEQRKEDATRHRREEMKAARSEARARQAEEETRLYGPKAAVENSPHKNRYNSAITALEAENETSRNIVPARQPFKTTLPDGDSRAYLMKKQRSMSLGLGPRKMSRAKSMRLPLERIPENDKLHSLLISLSADMTKLRAITANLKQADLYIQRGVVGSGLVFNDAEKENINSKVQAIVEKWKGRDGTVYEDHDEGGVQVTVSG
jgi:DNA mismatch repair protein MutL